MIDLNLKNIIQNYLQDISFESHGLFISSNKIKTNNKLQTTHSLQKNPACPSLRQFLLIHEYRTVRLFTNLCRIVSFRSKLMQTAAINGGIKFEIITNFLFAFAFENTTFLISSQVLDTSFVPHLKVDSY